VKQASRFVPFPWLVGRPRVLTIEAASLEDPALLAAIRGRFAPTHLRVGVARPMPTPAESSPHLEGSVFSLPGVHRLRAIETTEGALDLRFPHSGPDDRPLVVQARPGTIVTYDVDRDAVAFEPAPGWQGRVVEVTSSMLPWTLAPLPSRSPIRDLVARKLGGGFVLWVTCLGLACALARSPLPAIVGGSYVHYLLYLAALAHGPGLVYPELLRDAVAHKSLSMLILGALYLASGEVHWISLALVAIGLALSNWAAIVLGLTRTYFGVELGVVTPQRIDAAPYGVVPHPMITGAVVALGGVALSPSLREAYPWLVPGHITLYLMHLAQEIYLGRHSAT
jgi:hypothetical protein